MRGREETQELANRTVLRRKTSDVDVDGAASRGVFVCDIEQEVKAFEWSEDSAAKTKQIWSVTLGISRNAVQVIKMSSYVVTI